MYNTAAKIIRPNWDSHEDIVRDHGYWGPILDTGAAALLAALKSRGLLDSTLVICTSEFGRQPAAQGAGKGRDHNPGAFTAWLAGGGIKGGTAVGETDDLGFKAAVDPACCYDLHATALHLLGLNHEKLSFYNNGIARRLTDVRLSLIAGWIAGNAAKPAEAKPADMNVALMRLPLSEVDDAIGWPMQWSDRIEGDGAPALLRVWLLFQRNLTIAKTRANEMMMAALNNIST